MLRSPLGWWSSITQVSRWHQPLFSNQTDSLFIPNSLDGKAAAIGGTYPPTLGQIEAVEFLLKRVIHLRLCACVTIWPTLASSLTTPGRQIKKSEQQKASKKKRNEKILSRRMPTTKLWASSLTSFSHSLVLPSLQPSWCSGSSSKIEKVKVMFFPIDALDLQVSLEKSESDVLTFPKTVTVKVNVMFLPFPGPIPEAARARLRRIIATGVSSSPKLAGLFWLDSLRCFCISCIGGKIL